MLTKEEKLNLLYLIEEKPVEAIEKLFSCNVWEKQREIINSVLLEHNRKTAVRSCHDSGKSFVAGRLALAYLIANKNSLVVTTAPSWTQVREILWREIRACYGNLESSGMFTVGAKMLGGTKIEIGANWFAIGISTRKEGDSTDVADRMLGFHSPSGKILIIVDEGSGIQEPIWGAIDGLLTSSYAQLVAFGNPYRKTGTFAKMFSSAGVKKIHIQDTDIPNIKENKVVVAGLMSPDYPKEMEEKYGKESNLYRIKVKGEFPLSEADTLIPLSDVEDSFLREEVVGDGEKKLGVDVARFGDDRTTFVIRQGRKVLLKECFKKEDTMETVGRIVEKIITEGLKPENVSVDDIGVGGGVVDRLYEKGYNVNGVNVGMRAEVEEEEFTGEKDKTKEKRFFNTRASSYWAVRDWIKNASLPRDDDFLELSNIKYKFSSTGIRIEPKDEMKKRGLISPDVADALMLTFCPNISDGYGHLEFF
jgi:hypothetical protein